MAAISVHISDEMLAELRTKATARGKSVDELTADALRRGLEDQSWQELLAYGRQRGSASGYSEADIPRVVRDWRREQRGQ